jgi:hypothetical protein
MSITVLQDSRLTLHKYFEAETLCLQFFSSAKELVLLSYSQQHFGLLLFAKESTITNKSDYDSFQEGHHDEHAQ